MYIYTQYSYTIFLLPHTFLRYSVHLSLVLRRVCLSKPVRFLGHHICAWSRDDGIRGLKSISLRVYTGERGSKGEKEGEKEGGREEDTSRMGDRK